MKRMFLALLLSCSIAALGSTSEVVIPDRCILKKRASELGISDRLEKTGLIEKLAGVENLSYNMIAIDVSRAIDRLYPKPKTGERDDKDRVDTFKMKVYSVFVSEEVRNTMVALLGDKDIPGF